MARPLARLAGAALLATACTTLVGLDEDYTYVPPASGGTPSGGASDGSLDGSGGSAGNDAGSSGSDASMGGATGGADSGGAGGGADTGGGGGEAGDAGDAGDAGLGPGCTIVPLYAPPVSSAWQTLADAANKHPTVEILVIVNPDNGPGTAADATLTAAIGLVKSAGVEPIAYVATAAATKPATNIKQEIDAYASFYPALEGVFFDQATPNGGNEAYYADVSAHAASKSLADIVANPGAAIASPYLAIFDVVVVYQSAGKPSESALAQATQSTMPSQAAIWPLDVATFDAAFVSTARKYARCIYVTDDTLPAPYDTLPSYFDALLTALE